MALGCVDISSQPNKCTDKIQKAKIRSIELLKSGKHPAKMLELIDKTLFILAAAISLITIALQSYIGDIRYKKLTEETTA